MLIFSQLQSSNRYLPNHCIIPDAVGTCTTLLGTCLNANIFKLPAVHQSLERDVAPW